MRCTVASGYADTLHVTSGVSSNLKCRDPGASLGYSTFCEVGLRRAVALGYVYIVHVT